MHRRYPVYLFVFLNLCDLCGLLFAQHAVDPANRYYRLVCLVHLTGSGKGNDPIVPEYVVAGMATATGVTGATGTTGASHASPPPTDGTIPSTAAVTTSSRPGIISWAMQMTDDKKMAIIHIVAADRAAFDDILNDKRPEVKIFVIGKDSKDDIEKEMKKYKKDFSLNSFQVVAR